MLARVRITSIARWGNRRLHKAALSSPGRSGRHMALHPMAESAHQMSLYDKAPDRIMQSQ